jgi:hypothetical protein
MRSNNVICILLWITLVNATNRHLRGSETSRLSSNQLVLGGGPLDPEDCPLADVSVVCPETNNTISCRSCKYGNECLASSAGFLIRRDCQISALVFKDPASLSDELDCPAVPPSNLCLDLIKPVSCSGCEYGSKCFAAEAGFDVVNECEAVATPPPLEEGYINPVFLKNCPVQDSLVNCTGRNDTVVCGPEYCEYNSTCSAYAAGWNETFCEEPAFDLSLCPSISSEGDSCPTTSEPFICQYCPYDNLCLALAAGYNTTDCEKIIIEAEAEREPDPELEPEPEPNICPAVFAAVAFSCGEPIGDPVVCKGCDYSTKCLAAGAGFNIKLDCQLRNPPDQRAVVLEAPSCRNVTGNVTCPDVFEPVFCESCEYENSCLAAAAGYNTTECQSTPPVEVVIVEEEAPAVVLDLEVCPPITFSLPCTGSPKPVRCRGCEYENRCFAAGAGFDNDDCEIIPPPPYVCPNITANLCSTVPNPVVCNAVCEYDNSCLALSAGFESQSCENMEDSGNMTSIGGTNGTSGNQAAESALGGALQQAGNSTNSTSDTSGNPMAGSEYGESAGDQPADNSTDTSSGGNQQAGTIVVVSAIQQAEDDAAAAEQAKNKTNGSLQFGTNFGAGTTSQQTSNTTGNTGAGNTQFGGNGANLQFGGGVGGSFGGDGNRTNNVNQGTDVTQQDDQTGGGGGSFGGGFGGSGGRTFGGQASAGDTFQSFGGGQR